MQMKAGGQSRSVATHLSDAYSREVQENRLYIARVADILRFTAVQGISQRGHDESARNENKGNFVELLNLFAKYDDIIGKKLNGGAANAKYVHHSIQDQILEILSHITLTSIKEEMKSSQCFALIVDETKDLSKTEQLSVVVRYYLNGAVFERFLGFRNAVQLDAKSLLSYVKETLNRCGVDSQLHQNEVGCPFEASWMQCAGTVNPASQKSPPLCAAISDDNAELLIDIWKSMERHVANIHLGLYTHCDHSDLGERQCLIPGTPVHDKFTDVVMAPRLLKDIRQLAPSTHTFSLEQCVDRLRTKVCASHLRACVQEAPDVVVLVWGKAVGSPWKVQVPVAPVSPSPGSTVPEPSDYDEEDTLECPKS
ncbi:hypothetical protein HPB50_021177 [Hyalomma asiaticum]|uniref:Uncharacterized protein n=1 Tax=Hyalomma asiaticum TaxID=266040 RepID=A0ACB7S0J1_HYAAI|nr:hypothetical protein HPB50_021177 [Hyalomma asiaticum]